MLNEVKRIIEDGHLGVRTYEKFMQACLQHAAAGDEDAVSLFIFAKLVQPFVEYYSDQALSDARANGFRNMLLRALDACVSAPNLEARQQVLREVIQHNLQDRSEG